MTNARVLEIVAEELGAGKVTEDMHLVDDLGADSLDLVEIAMALEGDAWDKAGADWDVLDKEREAWVTVADVVRSVERRSQACAPDGSDGSGATTTSQRSRDE